MKYLLFIFPAILFISCHDLHQKMYDTFHGKKDSVTKKDTLGSITFQLTPEEEKDSFTDGSTPTPWENAGIENVKGIKIFIKKLQYWSANDVKDSIAANIKYPLLTDEKISSRSVFLQQYNVLLNAKVKQALREQKLNSLFRNFQGVMIGTGAIWVANVSEGKHEDYKIVSINNE